MTMGYDPFFGTATGYNPSQAQNVYNTASLASQNAYQQAMLQNQSDTLAFQKAQQAFTDAMSLGSAYGYSMGGNPYNFGSMMLPPAGTPLQSTMNVMGYAGAIPGYTGYNTGQTLTQAQQAAAQAAQTAGITGVYTQPVQSPYSPGTFVQVPQNQLPAGFTQAGGNYAIGYVTPSGQVQQLSQQQAQAMGYQPGTAANIGFDQFMQLTKAPPTTTPTLSLQAQQAYQAMNAQAQQAALAESQATGMYQAPQQILAPGTNIGGGKFSDLDQGTQQSYMMAYHGDPNAAMQAWVNDSNAAIRSAAAQAGQPVPGTPPAAQETMAAQQQYFNQAQQLAQTYGQYYAPTAPGQAAQAGVNAPQAGQETLAYQQWQQQSAMQYLQLLSQLQGPADYGQYLKVLGSTPSGIQGLVGAAAGQYVPGTGVSGTAPQQQTLQNLIGAATGYAGGGTGANAATTGQQQGTGTGGTASPGGQNYQDFMATAQGLPPPSQIAPQSFNNMLPSQQQMLGSMYSNLGYSPGDINKMYQASLPKYAAGSSAGSFRLV